MIDVGFKIASSKEDVQHVMKMRYDIFTVEQGISHEVDDDGLDESSIHILAYDLATSIPLASGRLTISHRTGILSRIAVYKEYRGLKLGRKVVAHLEKCAVENKVHKLSLHPHAYLERFYTELGYQTVEGEKRVGEYVLLTMTKEI